MRNSWNNQSMRWVWLVIPLVLIGIIGIEQSFAEQFSFNWGKHNQDNRNVVFDSPKSQLKDGAEPREVICDAYLYLIYKTSDGSPICVKVHYTVPKLIERGFATLGKTSLVITTDKEMYSLGESITITMKNQGDTTLIFSGAPIFSMESQLEKYIDFPLDVVFPPTENIVSFDTLASTTYVWNQTKRNLEIVNASTYTVYATFLEPVFIENIPHQLSHKEMRIEKTFEIID